MARENFNNDELTTYYSKIYASLESETEKDPFGSYVLSRVKGGQKTVMNKSQSEIRNFDMSFLDTIESVYPAILKIMRDPKKSLRYETEVVAVEKAKKVNSDTVRHLSSHTQLIKEITKSGDVIPSKVQTTYAEEELAIYENRFIKSLVKRIEMFLERRYEVMKVSLESFETEKLNVKNEFKMSGQQVTVEVNVAIKNDLTTNVETTKEQYNRLLNIREMIQGLKGTDFMRALAKARDVLPPIMKTNIIMHNPDFKLCYGLWLYLDRVDSIATNIDVKEKSYKYSQIFDKDINECMALAVTSFIKNRQIDDIYSSKKLQSQKAPKPILDNSPELELNLEADNKKLEDYTMNELLLQQTAKFFESSLEGMSSTGQTYNESIRVVYRQMLDMLDQIYPKAFGIADDELDSKDLYEQLEYARRQMMVLKIVRQQKQMNIARMGREEKRVEKLIEKLEEKIKKQEAREREKAEREAARAEAERLAEIERQKAIEARKRKFENDAIEKAKAVELRRQDMLKSDKEKRERERESLARIYDAHQAKRNHLKEAQEAENKNFKPMTPTEFAEAEPTQVPIRRRDEYDDLTDEELEKLMAENDMLDMLDSVPEKKPASESKKEAPKKEAKEEEKKPTVSAKPKKKKSNDISDDLDNLSDDELDALLAENGMLDGQDVNFNASDLRDIPDDEPEEVEEPAAEEAPEAPAEPEATEEPQEEAPAEEPTEEPTEESEPKAEPEPEEITDDDLDALLNDIPEAEADDASEEAPEETSEEAPSDDAMSDDDLDALLNEIPEAEPEEPEEAPADDSMSDDDLDALLNDIPELESEPEPEPQEEEKPKKKKKKDDSDDSDDDLDNLSDDELEALLKENGMI